MIIEYKRLRPNAHPPNRANPSDAGLDVFYSPKPGEDSVLLKPGKSAILATGLKFGVPHGYMLQVMNRSSIAAKQSLIVGAHVVDAGYNGEVFINLHNIGTEAQTVEPGTRIAQGVIIPVICARPVEYELDELYSRAYTNSNRGDGALGSTDG